MARAYYAMAARKQTAGVSMTRLGQERFFAQNVGLVAASIWSCDSNPATS
jgi:hypothetical protein